VIAVRPLESLPPDASDRGNPGSRQTGAVLALLEEVRVSMSVAELRQRAVYRSEDFE
jgi:hypothetical protein